MLFIDGREKDLIIIRGSNHVAQEFEECLEDLDGVRKGCAVALGFVPEEGRGEQLLVLAERPRTVGSNRNDARVGEVIGRVILNRTGIKPHTVRLLAPGTLPRTSSGKLRRAEALRQFLAGELMPPRKVGRVRLLLEVVRSSLAFVRVRLGREG